MIVLWLVLAFGAGIGTGVVVQVSRTDRLLARMSPSEIKQLGARVRARKGAMP